MSTPKKRGGSVAEIKVLSLAHVGWVASTRGSVFVRRFLEAVLKGLAAGLELLLEETICHRRC